MSEERCPCGTHTKAACDFAGSCKPLATYRANVAKQAAPAMPSPPSTAERMTTEQVACMGFDAFRILQGMEPKTYTAKEICDALTAPIPAPAQQPEPTNQEKMAALRASYGLDAQGFEAPPVAAPVSQPDAGDVVAVNNIVVRAAAKDLFNKSFADPAVTISSQIESKRDAVQAAVLVFQAAMALPVDQSGVAGSAKGGITSDKSSDLAPTPAPSGPQDEQEAFEAWCISKKWSIKPARDESCNDYMDSSIELAWYGWQARAALALAQQSPTKGEGQ